MSNFTEILNPYIKVRNQVKDKNGDWIDESFSTVRENTRMISQLRKEIEKDGYVKLFEAEDEQTIIESFYIVATQNCFPAIWLNKSNENSNDRGTNLFYILNHRFRTSPSMQNIDSYGSDYFEVISKEEGVAEDGQDFYTVMLKKPISIPKGSVIGVKGSSDYNQVSCKLVVKTINKEEV